MTQSQAQRRLVKSPPELWAELSSADALGRHLSPFGEIRITRVEPETTVAWEGDRASGTVELEPAGWGTKVVLTATVPEPAPELAPPAVRTPPPPETPEPAPPAARETPPPPETPALEPASAPPKPHNVIAVRPVPRPQPVSAKAQPEARSGFFSRLFRRQPRPEPAPTAPAAEPASTAPAAYLESLPPAVVEPSVVAHAAARPATPPADTAVPDAPAARPAPPAPATPHLHSPGPPAPGPAPSPPDPDPAPTRDERPPPPDLDPERTVAILTDVLDDLGAAHHRPFSRG